MQPILLATDGSPTAADATQQPVLVVRSDTTAPAEVADEAPKLSVVT